MVLSDGEDPAAGVPQVAERRDQLLALLAQPHHDAGLRRDVRGVAAGPIEQLQRARVAPARSRHPVEARHRFRIVVEDVGACVEHGVQRRFIPRKSGISTSMRHCGSRARVSRIVSAKIDAPPSFRSSRSTEVMTT